MATDPRDQQAPNDPAAEGEEVEGFDAPDAGYEPEAEFDGETAELNRVKRVITVLWAPADAMRGVLANGGWLMPFLLLVICTVIFATLGGDTLTEYVIEQTEVQFEERVASGQMTQEQADMILEQQMNSGLIGLFMYINPILFSFPVKLVMAALFLLVGNVFLGASQPFKAYWSLAWYAAVIGALHMLLYGILLGITNDPHGGYLGLAVLTKGDPMSTAHKLAQAVNIFLIWEAIVVGIGLSVFSRRSVGQGILWALIVYLGIGVLSSMLFGQPVI